MMKASDSVRMSNASTIYVQVSCHEAVIQAVTAVMQDDQETTSYIKSPAATAEHENMAYVEEEEPRND